MGGSQSYSVTAVTQWYLEGSKLYGKKGKLYCNNFVCYLVLTIFIGCPSGGMCLFVLICVGFQTASVNFNASDLASMRGKVVAITGANKGIGFAAARQLIGLDAEVHLLCRDLTRAEEAKTKLLASPTSSATSSSTKKIFCHELDVSNFGNIRNFAQSFTKECPKLDVLINNAGCMPTTRTLTAEGNESIMATALGGTMLLTSLLIPILKKAEHPRVINVSSGGGYTVRAMIDDLNSLQMSKYDGTLIYAFAKRNQIELTEKWSTSLGPDSKIWIGSMHPGWSDTEGLQEAMSDFHGKNKGTLRSAAEGILCYHRCRFY